MSLEPSFYHSPMKYYFIYASGFVTKHCVLEQKKSHLEGACSNLSLAFCVVLVLLVFLNYCFNIFIVIERPLIHTPPP